MDIQSALIATAEEIGWSSARIAVTAGVSEAGARKWLTGQAVPGGDSLIALMRDMPGLSDRLGFAVKAAA